MAIPIAMLKLQDLLGAILVESPFKIGDIPPLRGLNALTKTSNNVTFTRNIKVTISEPIDRFSDYEVYSYADKSGVHITNIFVVGDFTKALFVYTTKNNSMYEEQVWQDPLCLGLCRIILLDYYLKKFDRIVSDATHTEMGGRYWKKLVTDALVKHYGVFVVDKNDRKIATIVDATEMGKYFTNSLNSLAYRFLIDKTV